VTLLYSTWCGGCIMPNTHRWCDSTVLYVVGRRHYAQYTLLMLLYCTLRGGVEALCPIHTADVTVLYSTWCGGGIMPNTHCWCDSTVLYVVRRRHYAQYTPLMWLYCTLRGAVEALCQYTLLMLLYCTLRGAAEALCPIHTADVTLLYSTWCGGGIMPNTHRWCDSTALYVVQRRHYAQYALLMLLYCTLRGGAEALCPIHTAGVTLLYCTWCGRGIMPNTHCWCDSTVLYVVRRRHYAQYTLLMWLYCTLRGGAEALCPIYTADVTLLYSTWCGGGIMPNTHRWCDSTVKSCWQCVLNLQLVGDSLDETEQICRRNSILNNN